MSEWVCQSGCVRVGVSEWVCQSGCVRVGVSEWVCQSGCVRVGVLATGRSNSKGSTFFDLVLQARVAQTSILKVLQNTSISGHAYHCLKMR